MSDVETCPKSIWDRGGWRSYTCGKPVKRNGLCGIHAAAEERRASNDAQRNAKRAQAQTIADRLEAHGVAAFVGLEGRVVISMAPDALADLLDRIAGDLA